MFSDYGQFLRDFPGQASGTGLAFGAARRDLLSFENFPTPYVTEKEIIYTFNFPACFLYLIFDLTENCFSSLTAILSVQAVSRLTPDEGLAQLKEVLCPMFGIPCEEELCVEEGSAGNVAAHLVFRAGAGTGC